MQDANEWEWETTPSNISRRHRWFVRKLFKRNSQPFESYDLLKSFRLEDIWYLSILEILIGLLTFHQSFRAIFIISFVFFCVDEEVVVVPSLLFIQHGNSKYSTIAVVKAVVLKTILIRIVYVEKTSVLTTSWNRKTRPNNKSNIIGSSENNNFHLVRRRYAMTIEKLIAFVINSTKKKIFMENVLNHSSVTSSHAKQTVSIWWFHYVVWNKKEWWELCRQIENNELDLKATHTHNSWKFNKRHCRPSITKKI